MSDGVGKEDDREFRATTDKMLLLIARLRDVERAKQQAPVGSGVFVEYAEQALTLARIVFRWSELQLQMAQASPSGVDRGLLSGTPLETIQARPLDRILANWREAELRLEIAEPGSAAAEEAVNDVERLRVEFYITQGTKVPRVLSRAPTSDWSV